MNDFYKYITKRGNSYEIRKDDESFGSYRRLTDALYERDRLIKADWCWDDVLQLEETKNFYEKMALPPFIHEYRHITKISQSYVVFKNGKYKGKFNNKRDAYEYAELIEGNVVRTNERYRVQRSINGTTRYFGDYKTLEEAKKRRDELIEKGWIDD